MDFHPVAQLFPMMTAEEYQALRDDIRLNGLREPIYVHEGKIIDGRNRYNACIELGIEPRYREWDGKGSLVAFVVSLNLHRRHLSSSQKAAIAVDMLPILEQENERQRRLKIGAARSGETGKITDPSQRSREQAAEMLGTNPQYVADAKRIKKDAPELLEKIRAGTVNIPEAKQIAKMPEGQREAVVSRMEQGQDIREATREVRRLEYEANLRGDVPLPEKKYRVIYADPPWKYGNSGLDEYGHAERHYRTMDVEEICALAVKEHAEDNAVLFLWVTSPMLEVAFPIIRAWGFEYKTSFVWDKVRKNYGYYNGVAHEFLLVCTRGSCTPDVKTLFDSVVTEERSDVHSEKPETFRRIIETLYPVGHRLELFARKASPGWDVWGNEA
jgi:N6-adenosine-specific RNA methylase IME4/ParB-like chromosome segregation protein Spo0J